MNNTVVDIGKNRTFLSILICFLLLLNAKQKIYFIKIVAKFTRVLKLFLEKIDLSMYITNQSIYYVYVYEGITVASPYGPKTFKNSG